MAPESLQIISFNCRGLREKRKRENLFFWLKEKHADIIYLQETYWTEEMIDIIKKEWEGEIILNPGTQHSKGTAVLFHKNITANKLNISNTHKSEDGRIVFINITVDEKCLSLINIYAPNNVRDRRSFFVKLEKWITKFSNNNEIIMGGDFNSTEKKCH